MINNNLDFEKNSNVLSNGATMATAAAAATASPTTTATSNNKTSTNDNSFFNRFERFDNRIAANLAAALTGSRFRSSSCGKSARTNANERTVVAGKGGTGTGTGLTNQHYHQQQQQQQQRQLQQQHQNRTQSHYPQHYNGSATMAGTRRQATMAGGGGGGGSVGGRTRTPTLASPMHGSMGRQRPLHLFTQSNLNCNDNEKVAHQTPSSDEDNSPTELNNCKRLADKPPLVKRLTMGLLRPNEESRPLVHSATPSATPHNGGGAAMASPARAPPKALGNAGALALAQRTHSGSYGGYIDTDGFEPEKFIASKFGDSCRQSLTAIPMLDNLNLNDNSEFQLKKRYLRETSSANSSPKIFAHRLRHNASAALSAARYGSTATAAGTCHDTHGYGDGDGDVAGDGDGDGGESARDAATTEDEECELKEASWFQAGISHDIAAEVLASKSPGAFLVRKSSSKPGCYALTLRVPSPPGPKIANYIILRTARGYKIKGFRKEFTTLKALITHHSVMPELLPVPLALPRPTNMTSSRRNLDDFDTYDSLQMLLKYLRAKNLETE